MSDALERICTQVTTQQVLRAIGMTVWPSGPIGGRGGCPLHPRTVSPTLQIFAHRWRCYLTACHREGDVLDLAAAHLGIYEQPDGRYDAAFWLVGRFKLDPTLAAELHAQRQGSGQEGADSDPPLSGPMPRDNRPEITGRTAEQLVRDRSAVAASPAGIDESEF